VRTKRGGGTSNQLQVLTSRGAVIKDVRGSTRREEGFRLPAQDSSSMRKRRTARKKECKQKSIVVAKKFLRKSKTKLERGG